MTDSEKRSKFDTHLDELFRFLDPAVMGETYRAALEAGDRAALIAACAAYCRSTPDWGVPTFEAGPYHAKTADRGVRGDVTVINIAHAFPDGKIDFLFNPTIEKPPVNHEWLWQLNRHGWWTEMALAYADTGDRRYADAFEAQLRDWIAQTDLVPNWNGPGSAWRTIECGLRLMTPWMICFNHFCRTGAVSDEAVCLMLASLHRQAVHLIAHPTGGNWLMMEMSGAYNFGSLFPMFTDAASIRREAAHRLTSQLESQVLPDGYHNELSPDYHIVTYGSSMGLYRTAKALGRLGELPDSFLDCLYRMGMAYVRTMTPALCQPRTNDCYTMATHRLTDSARGVFPDEPAFAFVSSKRAAGTPPAGDTPSAFLPWAGFAVMRGDWSADAAYLLFDVGPLGMAHMHQDKLNVNLWMGCRELVFDDGGGQYEQSAERAYGLSAFDHNTVLVDGMPQNRPDPKRVTQPIDARWTTNEVFDYACGDYTDGFGREQAHPAVHRREVRFCRPDLFILRDTLTSSDGQAHEYEQRLHLDTTVTRPADEVYPGAYLADYEGTVRLLVVPVDDAGEVSSVRAVCGQTNPLCGWFIGRNDLVNHPATTLLRVSSGVPDCHFTTLLIPLKADDPLPGVTVGADDLIRVRRAGREELVIDRMKLFE